MSLKRLRKRHGLRNPNSAVRFVGEFHPRICSCFRGSFRWRAWRKRWLVDGRSTVTWCSSRTFVGSHSSTVPWGVGIGGKLRWVMAVHQGRDTYNDHSKARDNDYYYNSQFYSDAFQRMANLARASFRIGGRWECVWRSGGKEGSSVSCGAKESEMTCLLGVHDDHCYR